MGFFGFLICAMQRLFKRLLYNYYPKFVKGAFQGLTQFLAPESPLKKMKNAFYFTLKAPFVLKIFKFLSRFFGHVGKRVD